MEGPSIVDGPRHRTLCQKPEWYDCETRHLTTNIGLYNRFEDGLYQIPHAYFELFHRTRTFTATVKELVAATVNHAPSKWGEAACTIIEFSVGVLRSEKIEFHRFLNSQRKSIYWILDEALLEICLDQWEDGRPNAMWDSVTKPIRLALASAQQKLPGWATLDLKEFLKDHPSEVTSANPFMTGYFQRTSAFLHQSGRVYEIERTIRMSGIGQLPNELANIIIEDVLDFEKLPVGNLKPLYVSKGKSRAI